jgi:hypothetical protein
MIPIWSLEVHLSTKNRIEEKLRAALSPTRLEVIDESQQHAGHQESSLGQSGGGACGVCGSMQRSDAEPFRKNVDTRRDSCGARMRGTSLLPGS